MNKKIVIFLLFNFTIYSENDRTRLSECPGIPVLCQCKLNEWAEFDLLPRLTSLRLKIRDSLTKMPNIRQLASPAKFQSDLHKDAQLLLQELTTPTIYKESFIKIQQDPERAAGVKKILTVIQNIINAYDYLGQHGILDLTPLYDTLDTNTPIIDTTIQEIEQSRKANFDILAPTKLPSCETPWIDPNLLCIGYSALTQPIWIDFDTCRPIYDVQEKTSTQKSTEFEQATESSNNKFSQEVQKPTELSIMEATTENETT